MLKNYSVEKLNQISKKKEIWCWGCGKKFNDMLYLYRQEPFVSRISALIDINSSLWGVLKEVGGKKIPVTSYDKVRRSRNGKILILITTERCQEVYAFISEKFGAGNLLCCKNPESYFTYAAVLQSLSGLFPVRRQILFQAGDEPHENAKALINYLTNEYKGKPYRLLLLEERNSHDMSGFPGVTVVDKDALRKKNSFKENFRYCFQVSASRFLIYENEPLKKLNKRQKLIFLNHGTIPLKDVSDVLRQPEEVDFTTCPSKGCAQIYERQYGLPGEKHLYMLPPRTELIKKSKYQLEKIIETGGRQVILWLPTFRALKGTDRRDSVHTDIIPLLKDRKHFEVLNQSLCDNHQLLLIKKHPKERGSLQIPGFCQNIELLTDEELFLAGLSLQEILGDTAALLTDYSGIAFEYLLLGNPIGYVLSDIGDYRRGFAYDNPEDYMPGMKINTLQELIRFLHELRNGTDRYKSEREKLVQQLFQGNERKNSSQEFIGFLDNLQIRKSI